MEDKGQVLTPQVMDALRLASKRSFYFFTKAILGYDKLDKDIHKPLCDLLQDLTKKNKKITLPRSWYKSTIATIAFPIWVATCVDRNVRVLVVQNSTSNAVAKGRAIRSTFESNQLFRALYPEMLPGTQNVWRDDALCISGRTKVGLVESTFEFAGTKTKLTGRHYDLIIEDDTVAPDLDDMNSEIVTPNPQDIEQAIGWHRQMTPLLVDAMESMSLVIGTRWAERDLLSYIDEHESKFYFSYERACRETNGKADPDGEITYPSRFGEEALELIEARVGPYMFSCLYLNKPLNSKTMLFQTEWVKFYEIEPQSLIVTISVDPAGDAEKSKGRDTDFNVIMVTGKDMETGTIYVLDYWRDKCNPGKVVTELFGMVRKWGPVKVLIEAVAYQNTFEYWLRESMKKQNTFFLTEGITHGKTKKVDRINGLQPIVQSQALVFRPWMRELLDEMKVFPLGAHDDLLDCLAMQQRVWALTSGMKPMRNVSREDDPMSIEGAIAELRGRANFKKREGFIFDVFEPSVN